MMDGGQTGKCRTHTHTHTHTQTQTQTHTVVTRFNVSWQTASGHKNQSFRSDDHLNQLEGLTPVRYEFLTGHGNIFH